MEFDLSSHVHCPFTFADDSTAGDNMLSGEAPVG